MDMDELIEKTIQDYCEEMGYGEKLTRKLSQIVKRYRGGAVEISDLGIFLNQLESLLGKE